MVSSRRLTPAPLTLLCVRFCNILAPFHLDSSVFGFLPCVPSRTEGSTRTRKDRSMISRESALRNPIDPSFSQRAIPRRAMLGGLSGAIAAVLASPRRVVAEDANRPNDPFILLLHGIYQPVVTGPDLGLSSVNLSDGTYSRTRIYP